MPGKVLTYLLLVQICSQLLKLQNHEQLWFIIGRLAVDYVLALHILVEWQPELKLGMIAACVNLKKQVGLMHHGAFWNLMWLSGIPARIIGLLSGHYSGTESDVNYGKGVSSFILWICEWSRVVTFPHHFSIPTDLGTWQHSELKSLWVICW